METVNAPCMCMCNGYDNKYVYLETMEPCKKFGIGVGEELRYRRSTCCIMNSKLSPEGGDILDKDEIIMKKSVAVKPDDTLSKIFTITKTDVAGEFGKYLPETESWSVSSGKIKYLDNTVKIGTVEYEFNDNEIYLYPEGVTVYEAQQISSGVPDMNKLKKHCDDKGILYSVFYYYIKSIDKFKDFNSEPFEVLFKNIVDENFNVQFSIRNRVALVDRLYYGGATKEISKMIDNAVKKAQSRRNRQLAETLEGKFKAKPNELSRKSTDTSEPTKRKISLAKDFVGGYDWKGIFNLMYNESSDKDEYVTWSWDMVRSNLRTFKGFKNKVPQYMPSIVELQRQYSEGKLQDKSYLQKRTSEMSKLKNKELMDSLQTWLRKGVYGLPLSAYIDYNTRGVTLVITHVNATDDEQEAVDEINNQINELKHQQLETEDDDKFNEIDEQINELKRERQKINNVTVPHISMGDSVLTGIIFGLR